jgi:hypothetical protein
MARASLSNLILRLRDLIGDNPTDEDCRQWTDNQLQTRLDGYQTRVRYAELCPQETILPGGTVQWLEHEAEYGDWEEDATFHDASYNALTPESSDWQQGKWTFEESTSVVLIVGKFYDLYGAAADVLEAWAAKLAGNFDFAPGDGQTFKRSQEREAKSALALTYRTQQRPIVAQNYRSDTN